MNKRSIGKLRPANRTKERSPNLTGKLALQRTTVNELATQIREDGGTEIICNVAGWFNADSAGKYITVEISPLFRRAARPVSIEVVRPSAWRKHPKRDTRSDGRAEVLILVSSIASCLPLPRRHHKMPSGNWLHDYDELYCVTNLAIAFCEEGSLNRSNVRLLAIVYDEIIEHACRNRSDGTASSGDRKKPD